VLLNIPRMSEIMQINRVKGPLLSELCRLCLLPPGIQSSKFTVRKIVSEFCRSVDQTTERNFDSGQQFDACFFLLSVFDCLRSELETLIQGEIKSTFTCMNCYDQLVTRSCVEPIISLPIHGQAIPEAIIDYYKTVIVARTCERCDHPFCQLDRSMPVVSDVIFLQLKRFMFSISENSVQKIETKVKAPSVLVLEGKTFELASFVTHLGSDGAGHYTATVWDKPSGKYNLCNDSEISMGISEERSKSDSGYVYCYLQTDQVNVQAAEALLPELDVPVTPKRTVSPQKIQRKRQKTETKLNVGQKMSFFEGCFGPEDPEILEEAKAKLSSIRQERIISMN
jgi:uncharacterized UBP type Zn finger protein